MLVRPLVASCVVLAALFVSSAARADDKPARADALFKEAKALVAQGRYADACPKLEESQSIDPAVGTQFNLADCYEHLGRTASAHALFTEVARVAKLAGKFEREKSARERADKLAPKLGRITIVVTAEVPGLEIQIAQKPLPKSDWGSAIPEDAGTYAVVASAPDHAPFETQAVVADGETRTIAIPALVSTAPPPPPPRSGLGVDPPPRPRGESAIVTMVFVSAGVGLAGVAVGTVAGIVAIAKHSSADKDCPKDTYHGNCPTQSGADEWNAATTAGTISTIGFVAGAVGIAGTVVFVLSIPKANVAVGPSSILVRGSF
jgi:hypothetical protein